MLILRRERFGGIDDQGDHVGARDGANGPHHAVLLDRPLDVAAPPDAGRIDQHNLLPVMVEERIRGVAGRPRHLRDHDALETQQGVEKRRLAHVGPPHDGQPQRHIVLLLFSIGGRQNGHQRIEHIAGAEALEGGDGDGLAQSKLVEFGGGEAAMRALGLVGGQHGWLRCAAQ